MAALLCVIGGCSVKEDRGACPCYVTVRTATEKDCIVSFFAADGSLLVRRTLTAAELTEGDNYTAVNRGEIYVSVLEGGDDMMLGADGSVTCRDAHEASPARAFAQRVSATGDAVTVQDTLLQQHARVTLLFAGAQEGSYPYDISVESGYDGFSLLTLEPVAGHFLYTPDMEGAGGAQFTLSRQKDGEAVSLFFLDRRTGVVLASYDLNFFLRQIDYSWTMPALYDITITIDFARSSLYIEVNDWDEVLYYDFVI